MEECIRVVLASDLHHCHHGWYGREAEERLEGFLTRYEAWRRENPVDCTILLGDYSLDFWAWEIGGSYVHHRESHTETFFRKFAARLPAPYIAIPGNHEQYSNADFQRFSGFERQGHIVAGKNLFILFDNYAGLLDPDFDSDGEYSPSDVGMARELMDRYPDCRVFLCAHFFDLQKETEAFRELVREERVVCLFQGHTHLSGLIPLGPEWGNKLICQTGNYSYSAHPRGPAASFWGWRELVISPRGIYTAYYTPDNDAEINGKVYRHAAARQDAAVLR